MAKRPVRLTFYLWRLVAARLGGSFVLLLGIYVLVDAIESASAARLPLSAIVAAYPFKLPLVAAHVAPLACALGALLALGALRRRGEWDAAAAAGIGPLPMLFGLAVVPIAIAIAAVPLVHFAAPRALQRFESKGSPPVARAADDAWWTRDGDALVRWRDAPGGPRAVVAIARGADGTAVGWDGPCGGGRRCGWRRDGGWGAGAPDREALGVHRPGRAPRPSSYGFVGAAIASPALLDLAAELEAHGQDAAPLRAEHALRTAVALGVAIVPVLALVLAFAFGVSRDTRLVGLGLLVAAAYWLAVATAWNGAALGALPPLWISAVVPAAFAVGIAVLSLRMPTGR